MKTVNFLGFTVCKQDLRSLVVDVLESDSVSVVNTINAHSYCMQRDDHQFRRALKNSSVLLPDGSGITLVGRLLNIALPKLSGYEFFLEVMVNLDEKSGRVFFLGSSEDVLEKIKIRAAKDFPNIEVGTLSPGFKDVFNSEDVGLFANEINGFMPDALFLGLTAPKQEKLAQDLRFLKTGPLIASVGAVFDFYAQTKKRPHEVLIKFHLEWLGRLISDPKRIYRRVFVSMPIFIGIVFWKWVRRDLQ